MISERLQDFLTAHCGIDEDLDDTTRLLLGSRGSELVGWLAPELDAAIRDHAISPSDAEYLMQRSFDDADAVAGWLAVLRQSWFEEGPAGR